MSLALVIEVIQGPQKGRRHILKRPMTTIGRSGANISLNDLSLDPIHAVILVHRDDVLLVMSDEESLNAIRRNELPPGSVSILGRAFKIGKNHFAIRQLHFRSIGEPSFVR